MPIADYIRPAISNGQPREQALIRRWWHEVHAARGCLVWEYYLRNCYVDAIWFPEASESRREISGADAPKNFPIQGLPVVLCEAKLRLTPELIGQALLYKVLAERAGAKVRSTVVFAETAQPDFMSAAEQLGLEVVVP